jgi:tetratricopeptide (TPR) repeat protein
MRWWKGVGKGRVSQWWVILAVVVMFLGSPAGTLKAVTVSFIAERDQTRLAAERAFAEAERLADQKNVDAIRQAIAKYEEAKPVSTARWVNDLGEKQKAGVLLSCCGGSARCTGSAISARSRRRWSTILRRWPSVPWGIRGSTLNNMGDRAGEAERSHDAQQYRRGVRRSRREAEGAGVLHSGAGPSSRCGGSGRGSHDAQQYRQGVLRSRREAEGAGVLHPGAGHHLALLGIGPGKPRRSTTSARCTDDLGEKRKALEYYTQALALSRAVGDRAGEATTLHNIGNVYADLGEKLKALDYLTQALALRPRCGGSGRGSQNAPQHRLCVLRSRREAEGAGVLHPGA